MSVRFSFLFLLLLIGNAASAGHVHSFNSDSFSLNQWRWSYTKDTAMFRAGFDDSKWNSTPDRAKPEIFNRPMWIRLQFRIDKKMVNEPLMFSITHLGASVIYLDGVKLYEFGNPEKPETYNNPQEFPVLFTLHDTAEHVLLVHYGNKNAGYNFRKLLNLDAGPQMLMYEASSGVDSVITKTRGISFVAGILAGLFFALSILHFFIFLYDRKQKAHGQYSLFAACIGWAFVTLFVQFGSHSVAWILNTGFVYPIVLGAGLISLVNFLHSLMPERKKFGYFISLGLFAAVVIFRLSGSTLANLFIQILVIGSCMDALISVIISLRRKSPGAGIIGWGILFSGGFLISIVVIGMLNGGTINISENWLAAVLFLMLLAAAIVSIPLSMSMYLAWSFFHLNRNLLQKLQEVEALSEKTIQQEQEKQQILSGQKEKLEQEVVIRTAEVVRQKEELEIRNREISEEKKKSDTLLLNILPEEVAEELKTRGSAEARLLDHVTVMFTDFKNFTQIAEQMTPAQLVAEIHTCFKAFDEIISRHNVEKIKTIGDSYMCAGGLPLASPLHAENVIAAAVEMLAFVKQHAAERMAAGLPPFEIRIGVHSGPVVAGIVGVKKFAYDIWGDTVNTASRMESSGAPGRINISQTTWQLIQHKYPCTPRGKVEAKGKGAVEMYFLGTEPA